MLLLPSLPQEALSFKLSIPEFFIKDSSEILQPAEIDGNRPHLEFLANLEEPS